MARVSVVSEDFDYKEEAEMWKTLYLKNYNPMGYGTSIEVKFLPVTKKYVVTGSRNSSCG